MLLGPAVAVGHTGVRTLGVRSRVAPRDPRAQIVTHRTAGWAEVWGLSTQNQGCDLRHEVCSFLVFRDQLGHGDEMGVGWNGREGVR